MASHKGKKHFHTLSDMVARDEPGAPMDSESSKEREAISSEISLANGYVSDLTQMNSSMISPEQKALDYYESQHPNRPLVALQKHVLFWDQDCDGIIWPRQIYQGFRALGFCVLFSLGALLIPFFFSYPTRLGHSWIPDPFFRIYVDVGHKCVHGSDTGIYTFDGHFHEQRFEEVFSYFDRSETGGLSAEDLLLLLSRNRCAADPAGWCFAFMEWWTTWLLMQRDGRVWKDDLKACYDGTLFWKIQKARQPGGEGWDQGYGFREFLEGIWKAGTWRHWEVKKL